MKRGVTGVSESPGIERSGIPEVSVKPHTKCSERFFFAY